MAGKIKGITIEYDASTVKLQTALNKIKAESGSVESELRKVNQNLKFDPKNTELLATKQQLLKNRISQAKTQLSDFRKVQMQLDAQKVDKTSTEYLKVKRAVLEAESKVRTFNAQLAKLQWQGVSKTGAAIKGVGDKLSHATRYARLFAGALAGIALYKGFERLKSLDEVSKQLEVLGYKGKKLDSIMSDVSGSVDGTRFMLQDMAKVASGALGSGVTSDYKLDEYLTRTADLAQLAGIDVQSMGAMMNKAYSRGKVDAKIMNQLNAHGIPIYKLMQKELGVTAEELQAMSKKGELSFDDLYRATNRYQGLAQKMGTETLPGALTVLQQQLGLIGAEFLSGVYEPLKSGTKDIVAAIKKMRKDGTFKAWGEDFGNTVKYLIEIFKTGEASMDGMSDRAKNMATALEPLIKTVSGVTKAFAGLPPEIQGAVVLFTLFGGPLLSGVGSAVTGFASLATNVQTFVMNAQAGVLPTSQLAGGISGMGSAVGLILNPFTLAIAAVAAWSLGMKKMYDETHKSTQAFAEFEEAAESEIDGVKASNAELDLYKKRLDELVDKEKKSASDKALIKAYVDKLNGAIDGLNLKYDEEKDKLNQTSDAIQKKIDKYKEQALVKVYQEEITKAARQEIEAQKDLEAALEEQKAAQDKWNKSTDHGRMAQIGFEANMSKANAKVKNAKKAINDARGAMDKWAKKADTAGKQASSSLSKTSEKFGKEGKSATNKYTSQISGGKGKAKTAADAVAKSAKSGLSVSTTGLGRDFGNGFKGGILSTVRGVANAAAKLVGDAISAAKKKQKSGSPSKVMRTVGQEYGQGYMLGLGDEKIPVQRAASNLVGAAIGAATIPTRTVNQAAGSSSVSNTSSSRIQNVFNIYDATDADEVAEKIANKLELEVTMEAL